MSKKKRIHCLIKQLQQTFKTILDGSQVLMSVTDRKAQINQENIKQVARNSPGLFRPNGPAHQHGHGPLRRVPSGRCGRSVDGTEQPPEAGDAAPSGGVGADSPRFDRLRSV